MFTPLFTPLVVSLVVSVWYSLLYSLFYPLLYSPCGIPMLYSLVVQSLLSLVVFSLCTHWVHPVSLYQSGVLPWLYPLWLLIGVHPLLYPIYYIPGIPVWGVFWGGFLLDTPTDKYLILSSPGCILVVLIGLLHPRVSYIYVLP